MKKVSNKKVSVYDLMIIKRKLEADASTDGVVMNIHASSTIVTLRTGESTTICLDTTGEIVILEVALPRMRKWLVDNETKLIKMLLFAKSVLRPNSLSLEN